MTKDDPVCWCKHSFREHIDGVCQSCLYSLLGLQDPKHVFRPITWLRRQRFRHRG